MDPGSADEALQLFAELIELDAGTRAARLEASNAPAPAVAEVRALLGAADRAGDFLGVLADPTAALPVPNTGGVERELIVGRYRIEHTLGSGSMGVVQLAWDGQLQRHIALKFVSPAVTGGDDATTRFLDEARAAARLDHPSVGTVHDVGTTPDGQQFIAMTYYSGGTLRERLTRGAMAEHDAIRITAQIAAALAAAHAAGIVHRDVKPANILFDASGRARLTDFGIAMHVTGPAELRSRTPAGTPAYMSPEQARGEATGSACDLWALGVVMHEMLTGHRPHAASAEAATLEQIFELDAAIPARLRHLLADLLAHDPVHRTTSALDACQLLDEIIVSDELARLDAITRRGTVLPSPVTSFIGRDRELAAADVLLGKTRLLTLTGSGGSGKTRLALEIAMRVRGRYDDGAWFVPLAEIAEAERVPAAIAHALGVRDLGGTPVAERVLFALRSKRALLVLDNFEHVLDAATFVASLLSGCPGVTVLVTSRESLGTQGEHELAVPPLDTSSSAGGAGVESAAVQLFVSRAQAVRPSFVLDPATLSVVREICRRLDGLPLALELAAARAKLLSPQAMLSRLEDRFELLRTASPDRPPRHSTMRAVMDWSYVLLTAAERSLFMRLCVFAGGIPLDGAEAVAIDVRAGSTALELLESLCNKSLLRQSEAANGEPRFVMLETVREFGLEKLRASGTERAAQLAHRTHFLALAERASPLLRGPEQIAWLDRLEDEYANLRAALDGALADPPDLVDAARLAVALHRLWLTRGPLLEGSDYLGRILALADASDPSPLATPDLARVLSSAAQLAGSRSVFPEARDLFARSLELHRANGDRAAAAETLNNLAWQVWNVGDLASGDAMSREAMAIHEQLGDDLGVALSRNNLAWIALERGDFAAGSDHFEAVIAAHRRRGDARAASFAMSWLGVLESRRGALDRAIELQERALAEGGAVVDRGFEVLVRVRLAAHHHARRDPGDHVGNVERTYLPALRSHGRLWPLGYALHELGVMLLDHGEHARARDAFREALAVRQTTGSAAGVVESLLFTGIVDRVLGDAHAGASAIDRALEGARAYGAPLLIAACLEAQHA